MDVEELRSLEHEALIRMSGLIAAATPDRLGDPTPCDEWSVADLVEHVVGLTMGFATALRRGDAPSAAYRPRPASRWPDAVRAMETALASGSWEAEVRIAPVCDDLSFPRHHVVAMHLLDVAAHGWDLARALGVDYDPGVAEVAAVQGMAELIAARPVPSTREQFAAPILARDETTSGWERVLRRLGRDPSWQPPAHAPAPPLEAIGITERLSRFTETWSPKVICRVDDHEVKLVKLHGEFDWHTHPETDELFAVVTGAMRIEMRHGSVALGPGDLYVVPRGVEHRPVAEIPTEAVLLEPAGVVNTGDAGGALTAVDEVLV
jgi:uncharacterized protein (TIGR03086 family)